MNPKGFTQPNITTGKAIWLLLKLRALRLKNHLQMGNRSGITASLVGLFFLTIGWVFIYQFVSTVMSTEDGSQTSILLTVQILSISLFLFGKYTFAAKDIGSIHKDFEWLMTLPIPISTISSMKICHDALFNPFGSLVILPIIAFVSFNTHGLWAIVPALVVLYLPLTFALACLMQLLDNIIGFLFRSGIRKGMNLLFSISMFGAYFSLLRLMMVTEPRILTKWGETLSYYVEPCHWIPILKAPLIPIIMLKDPKAGAVEIGVYFLLCTAVILSSKLAMDALSARGFREKSDGQKRTKEQGKTIYVHSILSKEWLLIKREKRLWFSLLLPFGMILINDLVKGIEIENSRDVISQGFYVGLWIPITAIPLLALKERETIWLNFTYPQALTQQVVQKMMFWSMIAGSVSLLTIIGYLLVFDLPFERPIQIILVPLLIACIASVFYGMRLSNMEYGPNIESQRVNMTGLGTIYLLIASGTAAIYADELLNAFVTLFLFVFLAMAFWQQTSLRLPHILDADHKPPFRINLQHGAIAVLGFFTLQGWIFWVLHELGMVTFSMFISFGGAGLLVFLLSTGYFWYNKAQNIKEIFGFHVPKSWSFTIREILIWGAIAMLARIAYQPVIDWMDVVQSAQTNVEDISSTFKQYALAAILLAPIFEEIIFRGMVYTGIRQTKGRMFSVVFSAMIFALIHPILSWPPVFVLGVCCAYAYERTESLIPSMIIHFLFNVVAISLSLHLLG